MFSEDLYEYLNTHNFIGDEHDEQENKEEEKIKEAEKAEIIESNESEAEEQDASVEVQMAAQNRTLVVDKHAPMLSRSATKLEDGYDLGQNFFARRGDSLGFSQSQEPPFMTYPAS